jgi:hypothetical protein
MADFVNLYDWLQTVETGDFPPAPFKITPWMLVLDWDKYLHYLSHRGLQGPRTQTGAWQADLRRLYKLWNSGRTK